MAYAVHPAGIDDAEALADIMLQAFADDHIIGYMQKNVPYEVRHKHDTQMFHDFCVEGDVYGGRMTKVVDNATGETVAFARWVHPVKLTPQQAAEKEAKEQERVKKRQPEGTNTALTDEFFKQLMAGRKKWIDSENMYFLHILAVHPSHQRKGLGTLLIAPGLAAADAAGAKTYIEASPAGYPLYVKHGWEACDGMVIDMRPHGGEGIEHQKFLMRQPMAAGKV